ncbi:conserved protein of unknown function [Methylorubrum extorquens]|uniref:Uncharacterized protein n=1 Tax=Methylorubrum extorquens TaxID=408 RepID=A0A2N9APS4_METEX|nr:conserved protein of unknown function [Methylorubrum extorquens]
MDGDERQTLGAAPLEHRPHTGLQILRAGLFSERDASCEDDGGDQGKLHGGRSGKARRRPSRP